MVDEEEACRIKMQHQFPGDKEQRANPPTATAPKLPAGRVEQGGTKRNAVGGGDNEVEQVVFAQRHGGDEGNGGKGASGVEIHFARQAGHHQHNQHRPGEVH